MNEQTITQDRLAEEIDALLAPYPDPMSRNDFRIACHIGTRLRCICCRAVWCPASTPASAPAANKIARRTWQHAI